MKSFKKFKEQYGLDESLAEEYVLNSLADRDIMADIKDGKVVVCHEDVYATRKHLNKIGHGHMKVISNASVSEETAIDEVLDPSKGAGEYIKDFQKSDAPQFKGKSKEKRRQMGIAAYVAASKEQNK